MAKNKKAAPTKASMKPSAAAKPSGAKPGAPGKDDAPMKRMGAPEDMAGIALYLASRASGFVCGAVIPVDGGLATTA